MSKRLGVFSDVHGDKRKAALVAKVLRQLGVSSALFLGDAVYETMSDFTHSEALKSDQLRQALKQDSPFRRDVLEGLLSEEQLNQIFSAYEAGRTVAKKVAKAEYQDLKEILSGLEVAVIGGNWDYGAEIAEVFGSDYLNGTKKSIGGINLLGLSGGGSPHALTIAAETLADDPDRFGNRYEAWDQALLNREPLGIDLIASHLQLTDGERVRKENAAEHLKAIFKRRKKLGLDVPKAYFHGHKHETFVKYDGEMETFIVSPGSCSSNHNQNLPTFFVSEFDGQNQLVRVQQYTLFSALPGWSEVRWTGTYELDHAGKKVGFTEKNEKVLEEKDLPALKNNLSLDQNFSLTQAGLNVNYDGLNPKERDLLLRKNILVMQKELEKVSGKMKSIFSQAFTQYLVTESGKVEMSGLEEALASVRQGLVAEARSTLGMAAESASFALSSSGTSFAAPAAPAAFTRNADEQYLLDSLLIKAVFGLDTLKMRDQLHEKKVNSWSEASSWGAEIIQESGKALSRLYQNHILSNFKSEDWQSMAELYLPAAFERSKALGDEEAFQLWLNSYQHGFLTSDVVEASGAYRKKSGFAFNKKTKQEIAGRLGLTAEEAEDSEGAESMARTPSGTLERTVNDLPAEQIPRIREGISSGNIPILRDDHGEYLGAQGRKYYLDDAFKEGLEYTSRTEEEVLAEMIRNGIIPVIKRDNQEFLPQQNGLLAPFRPEQYGLAQGDYHPLSEQEYRQLQRDNLIRQRQEELDQMLQQREAEQNLPLAPRGEPSVDNTSASVPRII